MKKFLALILALMMALTLVACGDSSAPADDGGDTSGEAVDTPVTGNFSMGTGGDQGTYYAVGGVLGTVINQKTNGNIAINVVSTGGSKDNLDNMGLGVYQLATVQSDVMSYAYNGTNSFAESGAVTNFRVLCGLYAETVQVVTTNPDIKSIADLAGKKVCVGDVGSGTYFNTVDILAAYDMTLDDVEPVYQSFGDSTDSLQDGKIAAAVITAGAPTPAVETLSNAKDVYLVSIDDEHMAKLLKNSPQYASYTIAAGTYGIEEDAVTITTKATLVCSDTLTDDQAYAIVSTIFNSKDDIVALHAKGNELDFTFATEGMAVPFHNGAAKFFAEQGITVEAK